MENVNVIEYLRNRLERSDIGNNKGYRGHSMVIQETFFNTPSNIKLFVDSVYEIAYVDLSDKVNGLPSSESYAMLSDITSQSGVNYALLKNLVPTAHRMGIIELDKRGRENMGFKLSELGLLIKNVDNLPVNEQNREMYSLCDTIARNIFENYNKENGFDFITLIETFLQEYEFSSLDFNEIFILIDNDITDDEKKNLIFAYKRLTNTPIKRIKHENIVSNIFREYNVTTKTKLEKRDFGNVRNQIARLMEKLNLMILFAYDPTRLILTMKYSFGTIRHKYRSGSDIREAKTNHDIKVSGLDGHHMVPHDFITTSFGKDRKLIEDWKNIIFLDKENHNKFPNKKNPYLILSEDETNIIFTSIHDENDRILISKSTFNGDLSHIQLMIEHNKKILKYLFEVKLINS